MAPKRKSDQIDLDLTTSTDENDPAIVPTKRPRKSVEPSNSSLGKEKSTKPQVWQEVKLDREDEVRNIITRLSLPGLLNVLVSRLQGSVPV
jgi:hypothetical protein